MHIAEREFNRLISYAEGLGINVVWRQPGELDVPAQLLFTDPPTMELTVYKKINYTDRILDILHELGHYHDWLNNGKREPGKVFSKEHNELNRSEREVVYNDEKKATFLSIVIAKQLEIKYPKFNRIRAAAAYDRWYYRKFLTTGKPPTKKERKPKYKQIQAKYKELHE